MLKCGNCGITYSSDAGQTKNSCPRCGSFKIDKEYAMMEGMWLVEVRERDDEIKHLKKLYATTIHPKMAEKLKEKIKLTGLSLPGLNGIIDDFTKED